MHLTLTHLLLLLPPPIGAVFMTVGDMHDWYRRLFGNPEQLGLTPGEL